MRITLLLGLLFTTAALAAPTPAPEYTLSVQGELVIDDAGAVREYKLDDGLKPAVAQLVEKNVATWRFEPVLHEGKPVAARTRMSLELLAAPSDNGDYVLKVNDVFFGSMKSRGKIVPPRYPADALRNQVEARVILVARIDDEGNVTDVHPYQTSLSKDLRTPGMRRRFEEASMAAVRKWKYEPGEEIGGRVVGGSVKIPIMFHVSNDLSQSDKHRWRGFIPGPVSPAPWVDESAVAAVDDGRLEGNDAVSLDSRFALKSDVLGKAL